MTGSSWIWPGFLTFVAVILFVDLFVLHRRATVISIRAAIATVSAYVALAIAFGFLILGFEGPQRASEFATGYLLEQALSLDNIFVIALIFRYFRVPAEAQHRVLFYGIIGAVVLRLSLIVPGVHLVDRFHLLGIALGVLVIYSGFRMLRSEDETIDPGNSRIVRCLNSTGRVTDNYEGARFFLVRNGKLFMTPLFVVLVTVEVSDLVFAVDSIPAVLAISNDAFIVFSSNVFAVLGLRALFFVLSGMMREFRYLNTGLSLVLMFIGVKMVLAGQLEVPAMLSLAVVAILVAGSVLASLVSRAEEGPRQS